VLDLLRVLDEIDWPVTPTRRTGRTEMAELRDVPATAAHHRPAVGYAR
jgi:hypothetical protein